MSDSIDNRIVSMEFENAEFERRAAQTSKTIDKLDEQLQFKNAGKGFDETVAMMNRADFSSISDSVAALASRFSFFGSIGRDILNDLTGSLQTFTRQIAQTIDSLGVMAGLTSGFGQYESYISSTQTIAAALPDLSIEEIEGQLDQLVWFADETSYSFTDMVNSVGKFTAAGLGLGESITAMEGIANWAAASGVNARDATRAYYNLSQAIGMGKLTTMDWKSIENLGMATKEFKDAAIEAALNMGTIEQRADGFYAVTEKGTKKIADSWAELNSNFRNTLSEGWFDTKTMMNVFGRYGAFTDKVYEEYTKSWENATTGKLTGEIIEELDKTGYELGAKAFAAAQSAKTFHDSIDAVKDAVASGWMQTFKLIFGNLDEAKDLWSDVVESLWRTFAGGAEGRNTFLKLWHEGIMMTVSDIPELRKEILDFHDEMGKVDVPKFLAVRNGEVIQEQISGYEHFSHAFKTAFQIVADIAEQVRDSISGLFDRVAMLKNLIRGTVIVDLFVTSLQKNLAPTLERIDKVITIIGTTLKAVFGPIISTTFKVVGRVISEVAKTIADFIDNLELSEDGLTGFQKIGQGIAKAFDFVVLVFEKLAWALSPLLDIFGAIGELVLDVVSTFIDFGGAMAESVGESEEFNAAFSALRGIMQTVSRVVVSAIQSIKKIFDKLAPAITPTWEALKGLISVIWEFVSPAVDAFLAWLGSFEVDFGDLGDTILRVAPKIGAAISNIWNGIKKVWGAVQPYLQGLWDWLLGFMGNFSFDILQSRIQKFLDYWNQHIWPVLQKIWQTLKEVFSAAWKGLTTEWSEMNLGEKIDAAEGVAKILLIVQGIKTLKDSSKFIGAIKDLFETLSEAITPVKDFPSKILAVGIGLFFLTVALLALLSVPDDQLAKMAESFLALGGGLIGMFTVINKIPGGGGEKSALSTIALAISVLILVNSVIKLIDNIKDANEKDIYIAAGIIGGLILLLGIASALMNAGNKKSKSKGSKSKSGATLATVLSVLAIMYAVKQLVPVVISLSKSGLTEREMLIAGGIVGGLILLLGVATMLGGFGNAKFGTALSFVALAISLKLLLPVVLAVAELVKGASSDEAAKKNFETAMWIVGGAIALMGIMVALGGFSGADFGTALSFVALAAAIVVLIAVLSYIVDLINTASRDDVLVAAGIIAGLELVTGAMVAIAGKNSSWVGFASLLAAAADVVAIGWAISEIGKLPSDDIWNAGIVLALCEGVIGAMILLANLKASWAGFAALLAAAADVLAVAYALQMIGDIDDDKLTGAAVALDATLAVVGGMILLANIKASWAGFAILLAAAADVLAVAYALQMLSDISPTQLDVSAACLRGVLLILTLMVTVAGVTGSWESFATLLAAAADVLAVAYSLKMLADIPEDDLLRAKTTLDTVILVMTALVTVAGVAAGFTGAGTAITLAAVAAVILSIGAAAEMCAHAFLVFNQALGVLAVILPPLGVSITTFLQTLVDGIDETLHTIWENIKAWAIQLAYDMPKLGWDMINAFLQGFSDGFDEFRESKIVAIGGDIINGLIEGISSFLSTLWDKVKEIIDGIINFFKDLFGINSPSTVMQEFGEFIMEGLAKGFDKISEALEHIVTGFTTWWNNTKETAKKWGSDMWDKINSGLREGLDKIKETWEKIKTGWTNWWSEKKESIKQWGSDTWDKINSGLREGLDKIKDTWEKIKTGWSSWWNEKKDAIKQWGSDTWDKINSGLHEGLDKIKDTWDKIKTGWSSWWNSTKETVKQWGSDTWDKISSGIREGIDKIKTVWEGIKTKFSEWWNESDGSFLEFGKKVLGAIISGIGEKIEDIRTKAGEVGTSIKNAIRGMLGLDSGGGSMYTIGRDIINGIISGLTSMIETLKTKAQTIISNLPATVKKILKIESPSRVMMELGEYAMEGFAVGLENLGDEPGKIAEEAGTDAIDSLGNALSGLYQFAQYDDLDNEIHFTVVLDSDNAMQQLQELRAGGGAFQALGQMKLAARGFDMMQRVEAGFRPTIQRDQSQSQDANSETNSVTYVQNNYSPKSLSRFDIYRQTRAQLLEFKKG